MLSLSYLSMKQLLINPLKEKKMQRGDKREDPSGRYFETSVC